MIVLAVGIYLECVGKAHVHCGFHTRAHGATLAAVDRVGYKIDMRKFLGDLHQDFVAFGRIAVIDQNHGKIERGQLFDDRARSLFVPVHRHNCTNVNRGIIFSVLSQGTAPDS